MTINPFFKNNGPINIEKLLSNIKVENSENYKKDKIYNVADLVAATNLDNHLLKVLIKKL